MDLERVHPKLRYIARIPRRDAGSSFIRAVARVATRHLLPAARVPGVRIRDIASGDARLRLYVPDEQSGAGLLWIHGGGMVMGAPRQDDRVCAHTAALLGMTIASADYRLAPEHPFPIPQQDCMAVWTWLQSNASDLGVDPERIAIGGGSAGGGLAASVANTLHDAGGIQPVGQWLLYPMLDDRTALRTDLDSINHFVWNNTSNRFGWTALLRGTTTPGAADVPSAAAPARRGDLTGLPPAWIGVGDIDLFHDEDVEYARRLADAGVPVTLTVLPGAPHGFETLATKVPIVRELVDSARQWLADTTSR